MDTKFWLTVKTNGVLRQLYHKWNDFWLLWNKLGCRWLWLMEKFFSKKDWFFIFVCGIRLVEKSKNATTAKKCQCSLITGPKTNKCQYMALKRMNKNMAACLALQTFVIAGIVLFPFMDLDTRLSWTNPATKIDISKKLSTDFAASSKKLLSLVDFQGK